MFTRAMGVIGFCALTSCFHAAFSTSALEAIQHVPTSAWVQYDEATAEPPLERELSGYVPFMDEHNSRKN